MCSELQLTNNYQRGMITKLKLLNFSQNSYKYFLSIQRKAKTTFASVMEGERIKVEYPPETKLLSRGG